MDFALPLDIVEHLREIADKTGLETDQPDPWEPPQEETPPDPGDIAGPYRAFIQGGEPGVPLDLFRTEPDLM